MKSLKSLFKKQIEKDNIEQYYDHGNNNHEQIKPSYNSRGQGGEDIKKRTGNKYECPMKCEGDKVYDFPGNCPVCNMKLVPTDK